MIRWWPRRGVRGRRDRPSRATRCQLAVRSRQWTVATANLSLQLVRPQPQQPDQALRVAAVADRVVELGERDLFDLDPLVLLRLGLRVVEVGGEDRCGPPRPRSRASRSRWSGASTRARPCRSPRRARASPSRAAPPPPRRACPPAARRAPARRRARAAARRGTRARRRGRRPRRRPGVRRPRARPPRRRRSGRGPRARSRSCRSRSPCCRLAQTPSIASPEHAPAGERGAEEQLVLVGAAAHGTGGQAGLPVALEVGRARARLVVAGQVRVDALAAARRAPGAASAAAPSSCGARGRGGAGAGRRTTCAARRSRERPAPARRARCRAPLSRRGRAPSPSRGSPVPGPRSPRPSRAPRSPRAARPRPRSPRDRRRTPGRPSRDRRAGRGRPGRARRATAHPAARPRRSARSRFVRPAAPARPPTRRTEAGRAATTTATGRPASGASPSSGACSSTRVHGVLERRVVELHHVRALGARAVEAAREVHVDDVEAAAAEAEVDRGGVDHHVVARLDRAGHRLERERAAAARPSTSTVSSAAGPLALDGDDASAPQGEGAHAAALCWTMPSATSSIVSSASTVTRSSG